MGTTDEGNLIQARLDRILIPRTHLNKHSRGPGVWKFNTQVLKDPAFITSTHQVIDGLSRSDFDNPLEYWEALKASLKIHAMVYMKQKNLREKQELNATLVALQLEENKPNPSTIAISALKTKIAEIEIKKIDALLLHNKIDRIEFDEKPSSFFFARLKARAKKTHIDELHITNSNNIQETTTNQQKIQKSIHTFYSDLYNLHSEEIEEDAQTSLLNNLDKTLTETTVRNLEVDFTLTELMSYLGHGVAPLEKH